VDSKASYTVIRLLTAISEGASLTRKIASESIVEVFGIGAEGEPVSKVFANLTILGDLLDLDVGKGGIVEQSAVRDYYVSSCVVASLRR